MRRVVKRSKRWRRREERKKALFDLFVFSCGTPHPPQAVPLPPLGKATSPRLFGTSNVRRIGGEGKRETGLARSPTKACTPLPLRSIPSRVILSEPQVSRTFAVCRKSAVGFSPMRNLGRTTLFAPSSREILGANPSLLALVSLGFRLAQGLAQDDTRGWYGEGVLCLLPSPSATPPPLPKGEASVVTALATLPLLP